MDNIRETLKKVRETISRYGMTEPGERVIVAVSGGPDSVCLLDILNELSGELKISLVAAHYNHGLRNGEDEFETGLVRGMAESMGIPFEAEKSAFLSKEDASIEEKAREARYAFLQKVMGRYRACKIAMGHNLNDQAETVLMRMIRGSGPSGLAGIPPVRDKGIIRPLINIKREEIMAYVSARRLSYALDSSNSDTRYLRNRIRLELLPLMQDYQPRIIEHLGRLSDILKEEEDFLELMAAEWVDKESQKDSAGNIFVPVSSLEKLHTALKNRVIRLLLKNRVKNLRRIDSDHIRSISDLIGSRNPQAALNLPVSLIVRKVYDRLIFSLGKEQPIPDFSYSVPGPGTVYLEALDRTIRIEEIDGGMDPCSGSNEISACLDADMIQFPLFVRNFRPGDRFIPLGMKGHRKIKDFFIDLKVPSEIRVLTPILTSQDNIVWICGYRIDERYKVTDKTSKIFKITLS